MAPISNQHEKYVVYFVSTVIVGAAIGVIGFFASDRLQANGAIVTFDLGCVRERGMVADCQVVDHGHSLYHDFSKVAVKFHATPISRFRASTRLSARPSLAMMTEKQQTFRDVLPSACHRCDSVPHQQQHLSRRQALHVLGAGCACLTCCPAAVFGLAEVKDPDAAKLAQFATPRNAAQDEDFARSMEDTNMRSYELEIAPTKQKLFGQLLRTVPRDAPVVVELGIGTFPNAPFYAKADAPQRMDIVGVDPSAAMAPYAEKNAAAAGLAKLGHSVRVVNGIAEALPLADRSVDAVVCTQVLCSVADPAAAVAEVLRVLRPGGKFLFVEHILSPTNPEVAQQQRELTPMQVKTADNCHLDRETLRTVQAAGFSNVDAEVSDVYSFNDAGYYILTPTAAGIATV